MNIKVFILILLPKTMRKKGFGIIGRRLKFKKGLQRKFIYTIKKRKNLTWLALSKILEISEHTIKWDLFKEKSTMPLSLTEKMLKICPFEDIEIIKNKWVKQIYEKNWGQKSAGKKRIKKISLPKDKQKFAEFLGIMIGDGNLTKKGIRITGNALEKKHYNYISCLIEELFGLKSRIYLSYNSKNTIVLNLYSQKLADFLNKNGLSYGHKIKNKAHFPSWIFKDKKYIYPALRGLFDTDGGIFYKDRKYKRAIIEFETHSPTIRKDIIGLLLKTGFTPSKSSYNIRIQKQIEIFKFFNLIGSSNPKNIIRYHEFINNKNIPLKNELTAKILNYEGEIPYKSSRS